MNPSDQIKKTSKELFKLYAHTTADQPDRPLWDHPNTRAIIESLQILSDTLFPGKHFPKTPYFEDFFTNQLEAAVKVLLPEMEKAIPFLWISASEKETGKEAIVDIKGAATEMINKLIEALPTVRTMLIADVMAAYNGDPAALSYAEVKLAYPGVTAITSHRIAHELYKLDLPLIPRIMSEWTHSQTGIDIHPGATIGKGFFIDHGTGVVIGETCHIGDNVKLYQGVTLGAKSFPLDEYGRPIKHIQRHPTVEDNVIIYANSTILGGETVIGDGTVVAGNVFVLDSTPPNSLVTRCDSGIAVRPRKKSDKKL